MKQKPVGLDLVPFTPDWSLTFEENWQRYCEEYFKVYGEYPPLSKREVFSRQVRGERIEADSVTHEFSDRPTPSGAASSEIYYLDAEQNPVSKDKATRGIIRELDCEGNLVRETTGFFTSQPHRSNVHVPPPSSNSRKKKR